MNRRDLPLILALLIVLALSLLIITTTEPGSLWSK